MTSPTPLAARSTILLALLGALFLILAGCDSTAPIAPGGSAPGSPAALSVDDDPDLDEDDSPFGKKVTLYAEALDEAYLESLGVRILKRLPEIDGYVVRSTEGLDAAELADMLAEAGFETAVPDVRLDCAESEGMSVSFDEGMSVSFDDGMSVSFDDGMSVSFDDGISLPLVRGRLGGGADDQEALQRLRIRQAHGVTRGGGVQVALLDTGVDPTHPALYGRVLRGWDYVDKDDDPVETRDGFDSDYDGYADEAYGHGTHLAGLILLAAPEARVRVYRVLDSDGQGSGSRVAQAVIHAVHDGARVLNLSLGMTGDFAFVRRALDWAEERGVLVVTSAGNLGSTVEQYPAAYEAATGVGSVDGEDRVSTFSNRGDAVYVVAPGERLRSTVPGGYGTATGTSMSAALVSGLSALVADRYPDLDGAGIRARLAEATAPGTGLDGLTGHGRVDFLSAVH